MRTEGVSTTLAEVDNRGGCMLSEVARIESEAVTAPARFDEVVVEQSSVGERERDGEGVTSMSLRSRSGRWIAQGSPSSKSLVESR